MDPIEKLQLTLHILRWRLNWSKRNISYMPSGRISEKFITAREAAELIPDEAIAFSNGIAGNARCSIFFWAIRDRFLHTGHPRNLTWINVAAQGGRGKVPGTVEELGLPGLLRCYIAGHLETAKTLLSLADQGLLELHTLPQGVMTLLLEAQGNKQSDIKSKVGVGTFLDPQVGAGSAISRNPVKTLIIPDGGMLNYHIPPVEYTFFNAPYADAEGNIYFHHAATISENEYSQKAARANGGKVFATVSAIIPKAPESISMPAEMVDYIVVNPRNEQTATVPQRRYWPMFATGSISNLYRALARLRFINSFLKITPVRSKVDDIMARLAAQIFVENVPKGSMVNIGVGLPEEVVRCLMEHGLDKDLLFTSEAGAYGGIPVPGIFFGAAVNPQKLIASTEMFRLYQTELGAAILGFLQVDGAGNVNASRRGPKAVQVVGPGGFPDISDGAKVVIFVGAWTDHAEYRIEEGRLLMDHPGKAKFLHEVDEITFSAKEAIKAGKKVFYVTHVGAFQLTESGIELVKVVPGIDVKHDIIPTCSAHIRLPEDKNIAVADHSVVTGEGFRLGF